MKTSLIKAAMIGTALVACLSCSKSEDGDLTLTMTGSTSYLIPADAQSCTNVVAIAKNAATERATEVTSLYFNYQGASLSWKNLTDTAYIVSMDFEFTGSNFNNSCSISGDELLALFYDFGTKSDWDGTLAPATSAAAPTVRPSGSLCRIRCGGFSVTDTKKSFTVSGTVTVRGFQRSPSGDETPFKAKSSVKLLYQ